MTVLARGQSSDCATPALLTHTTLDGILLDAAAVEFQIFKDGQQLFPETPGDRSAVNVGAPCPAGDRLSTGTYVARWRPSESGPTGVHEIRWFVRMAPSSSEQSFSRRFEVLEGAVPRSAGRYAMVSDLREDGVALEQASDVRLLRLIDLASRYVERVTGRFFLPRRQALRLDGRGGRALLLSQPIIAVRAVELLPDVGSSGISLPVELAALRVYNRHLTEQLLLPDDRDNPRLEFVYIEELNGASLLRWGFSSSTCLAWPRGPQSVLVDGLFGYTDPDGSPTGTTPALIEHVTKLLVLRELPPLADADGRADAQQRFRLTSERTRDQSYTLQALQVLGAFTGDPSIDSILGAFCRPSDLGAA